MKKAVIDINTLKPCPFCGSSNLEIYKTCCGFQVHCKKCGSNGSHIEKGIYDPPKIRKAKQAWNNRINL